MAIAIDSESSGQGSLGGCNINCNEEDEVVITFLGLN